MILRAAEQRPLTPDDLRFAKIVVEQGLCGQDKIDECVSLTRAYRRAMLARFPEAAVDAKRAHALFAPGMTQKELARTRAESFRAGQMAGPK